MTSRPPPSILRCNCKRAGPRCGPNMRQDIFGQLCDGEIVFAYSELVYPDRLDLVIARNLVEAFARHVVMDIVKSTVDRAYRMRFQVYYACAAGGNEWNLNPPAVDIEFVASCRDRFDSDRDMNCGLLGNR